MKQVMIIKGDHNDGDYIHDISEISVEELLKFKPLFEAIKENGKDWNHNWCTSENSSNESPDEMYSDIDPEIILDFEEYVPHGEYGIHTINSIRILIVSEDTEFAK